MEGDGCFSLNVQQGGKYTYRKIEIHQKNLEPLEAIEQKFGMGLYRGKKLGVATAYGARADSIFSVMSPYLSSRRLKQAAEKGFVDTSYRREHDLSWFAGYYEAEGCIHVKTNGQFRKDGTQKLFTALTISQYYSDETSRFCQKALGFGRVAGPYMARGEKRAYSFNLSGDEAIKTVESIKHMLSEEKHRQLEEVTDKIGKRIL